MTATISRIWNHEAARPVSGAVAAMGAIQASLVVSGVVAARVLGVENRGRLAVLVLLIALVTQLGTLGAPAALTYFLSKGCSRSQLLHLIKPLAAAQLAVLSATVFFAIFGWFRVADPHAPLSLAALSAAIVPAILAQQYSLAVLQGERRFRAFNTVRTLPALTYSVALASLALAHAATLFVVVGVWLAATWFAAVVSTTVALNGGVASTSSAGPVTIRAILDFGFKAVLGAVSPTEVFRVDQAVVGLFLSPAALGLYVVGVAFTNLPKFFAQGIGQVAYPIVASKRSRQEGLCTATRFMVIGLGIVTAVIVPLAVFSRTLVRFFLGPDFAGAAPVTRVLLIAALVYSARRILSDCFQGLGAPKVGSLGEVATWVGLAATLPILLHRGIDGVAWSLLFASTVGLFVAAVAGTIELISRQARELHAVRIRRAVGIFAMGVCAAAVGSIVPVIPDLNFALIVALLAGSLFGIVIIAWGPPRAGSLALYLATATMAWTRVRVAGWLTLSDVLLILGLALLASSLPAGRLRAATANPIARGSFLILLGGLIASFVSPNVLDSVGNLAKFLLVSWAMLLAFILWKPAAVQIRRIVALWVISAATSAAVAISHTSAPETRPNGLAVHPNHLGLMSVLALDLPSRSR